MKKLMTSSLKQPSYSCFKMLCHACFSSFFVQALGKSYSHIRRTRGDGNCFFRAFGFGYLEHMLEDKKDYDV